MFRPASGLLSGAATHQTQELNFSLVYTACCSRLAGPGLRSTPKLRTATRAVFRNCFLGLRQNNDLGTPSAWFWALRLPSSVCLVVGRLAGTEDACKFFQVAVRADGALVVDRVTFAIELKAGSTSGNM